MSPMTIRSKLLIMLLMVGIVPFAVLGIISFSLSSGALQAQSFKELTAMREIKRAQLTAFFDDLVKSVEYVATVGTVQDHFIELAAIAEDEEIGVTSNDYADAIKDFDSDLKSQLGQFSDMYLISETGQVLYTAKAGSDFKASVNDDARIRDSSLARAFKGAMTDKTVFEDFSLYGPANVPLAFLATPIRQGNGKAIGVLAFALSPARLNKEMQVSRTLAESVDIFLVGTDKVFRSAPHVDPRQASLDTPGTRSALSGQEGQAIFDSLGGHVVLSSYAPVDIMGARWAIMAEMDKDDALSAVAVLKLSVSIIAAISIALIAALALFVSKSFTRPIIYAVSVAERIAANDLSTPITNARGDEIGQLLTALGHVVRELNGTLSKVTSSTSELAAASAQLSGTAKETSDAVSQQKRQMDQVVSAITELTASSEVVATNSTNTANAAAQADQEAKHGKALVAKVQDSIKSLSSGVEKATSANEELAQDSQDIGRILDVIRGIAEQTNLLALNAAIEAARAGDLGRGFAVVADEVRVLAQRSQEATEEIQAMISRLQTRSQHVVDLMCKGREEARESVELASTAFSSLDAILSSIEVIKEMSYQIATAAEEQTAVTAEINRNVDEISRMSDVTLSGADKESAASAALEQLAESLNNQVKVFKLESA